MMPRVCAVSYLNTVPLIWGLTRGPQRGCAEVAFALPSRCAEMLASGETDVGIVSSIEAPRQRMEYVPTLGIASKGAVRSILLVSRKPLGEIRVFAADSSSRSSTVLARVLLAKKYGCSPQVVARPPELETMLSDADAALIIGDPALRLNPAALSKAGYRVADLGREWTEFTGLPMVYAVWAGRKDAITPALRGMLEGSYRFGREQLDRIIREEATARGFEEELARKYLTEHIRFELDADYLRGMELYFRYAGELGLA